MYEHPVIVSPLKAFSTRLLSAYLGNDSRGRSLKGSYGNLLTLGQSALLALYIAREYISYAINNFYLRYRSIDFLCNVLNIESRNAVSYEVETESVRPVRNVTLPSEVSSALPVVELFSVAFTESCISFALAAMHY